jgi:CRP-like cAMP-binding protein/tRNA A-37 threonylcarbamoyl transferase component Bud32
MNRSLPAALHSDSLLESAATTHPRRGVAVALAAFALALAALYPPPSPAEALRERKFSDFYKLVEKTPLGQGAFAAVCAAVHRETGEVVAVKQIPRSPNGQNDAEVQAEVNILRTAGEHRHIIQLSDVFADDDYYYVVMEMAKGGELFDHIVNQGLLPEAETAALMRDLVDATCYLHNNGIIHGDIKPENIMLANPVDDTSRIDVRLGDFGTAMEVDPSAGSGTLSGNSRMTIAYCPPEVLTQSTSEGGDPSEERVEVSAKTDVWALGVLLYILLAGRHPFDMDLRADELEMERRIMNEEPSYDDPLWKDVSPLAVDLLKSMLNRDPTLRPTSQEVYDHPWFTATAEHSRVSSGEAREAFQQFNRGRRRIKACLLAVMAGLAGDQADRTHTALTRLRTGSRAIGSRTYACHVLDRGGKGFIDADDIMHVMNVMGERVSSKDVEQMLRAVDGDINTSTVTASYDQMTKLVPPLCPARVYQPGETVYLAGELDASFYLIKRGGVEFSITSDECGVSSPFSEVKLQSLGPGESFGEVELVLAKDALLPRACTCKCSVDGTGSGRCELLVMPKDLFGLITDVFASVEGQIQVQSALRLEQLTLEILKSAQGKQRLEIRAGEVVASQSDPEPSVILVTEGRVLSLSNGHRQVLGPDSFRFCGELPGLGSTNNQAGQIIAAEPAVVHKIPAKDVAAVLSKNGMAALRYHLGLPVTLRKSNKFL